MKHNFIAVDLGASNGRVMLGELIDGRLRLSEAHRFDNVPVEKDGSLYWNMDALEHEVHRGIEMACWTLKADPLHGASCDSWGVDYVLINRDGQLMAPPHHYRDRRTEGVMERLCANFGREKIFDRTGLQFLPFNTIYQLATEPPATLERVHCILMIADYFNYRMGGGMYGEVTIASTSQLVDPRTRSWDPELAGLLRIVREQNMGAGGKLAAPMLLGPLGGLASQARNVSVLPQLVEPGTYIGDREGFAVYASTSHDTAAAVAGCPGKGDDWVFLSSGTWSIMGVELPHPVVTKAALDGGLSNELGAAGTTRLVKNITGMWPLQQCRREWAAAGRTYSWEDLIALAEKAAPLTAVVDFDNRSFLTPGDMLGKIAEFCRETRQTPPEDVGTTVRLIFEGLALKCRRVVASLEGATGRKHNTINMVGGGSQNRLLCQWTADACRRQVVAGPVEATAAGNVLVQAVGAGAVKSMADAREILRRSFNLVTYDPNPSPAWEDAYDRLCRMIGD